jgi:UDP-N-acetylmuramyl tripeptide synthase
MNARMPRGTEAGKIPTCFIQVENSRKALACISNNFYRRPSEHLTLIGITGTNGKTTTSYILKSILEAHGQATGLIGTIHYIIKEKLYPALHTTRESRVSISASYNVASVHGRCVGNLSHAIQSGRHVFHTAVFTNLTRDHLDFHKTMESITGETAPVQRTPRGDGTAVINIDVGTEGWRLGCGWRIQAMHTFAWPEADVQYVISGTHLRIYGLPLVWKAHDVSSPLVGVPMSTI